MEEVSRTLVVSGKGIEKIPATSAQIKLAIEARGEVATEVQQEIARKSSAVVDLLRSLNVEQLKTLGIQLQKNYDYASNTTKFIGYQGGNTIIFNLPIDDAGVAIDEAVKAGASRVDGITFSAADEAINAAKQKALQKATIDAKTKAETVLTTLDLTINEIIAIEIDRARLQEVRSATRRRRRASLSSTPSGDEPSWKMPVVGGEIAIDAFITMEISY